METIYLLKLVPFIIVGLWMALYPERVRNFYHRYSKAGSWLEHVPSKEIRMAGIVWVLFETAMCMGASYTHLHQ
ncbi:MAG: hypothetical protein JST58_19920 [Bacteroidetes bacterium]|nr:hypothetical protein [Bacteroidota bacterium]